MIPLYDDKKKLLAQCLELIEACRVSCGNRSAYARQLNSIIETGKQDGTKSLLNMLYRQVDRTASHLFSPTELRFTIDFENPYAKNILEMGHTAAKILTRDWERHNTDMTFSRGVFESLKFGACILKQWVEEEGKDRLPCYKRSLVMPWQFGVYREDMNDLDRQSAMCESFVLSLPEVWRRICHLPNAQELYKRIKTHANKGLGESQFNSYFHQVLSTSTLNVSQTGMIRPQPGGIVQLNNDPNYAIVGPDVAIDLCLMHELWVQDENDYTTVQIIEPDVMIAPLYRRSNLLIPGDSHSKLHPYTLIQANEQQGYFWGRPEIADLIEPQGLLSVWADDTKRMFGLQIDKILAFTGFDGLADETYDQMRAAGMFNMPPGAQVNDITPKMPPETLKMLEFLQQTINSLGGFDNMLSGKNEPGVRAGSHAQMMMRTASPTLRDRSLLLERQCAMAADLRLSLMEAKDAHNYWTDGTNLETINKTSFRLADLPDDRRVAVDSHSSSPIFMDDNSQLVVWGTANGVVDGHSAIDMLPFTHKEILHQRLREKEEREAALIQQHPELLEQMAKHGGKKK
jgi:hypothetical protein